MQISATEMADIVSQAVPLSAKWWGKEQVANALSVSVSSVEKLSLRSDFPNSSRLPSRGSGPGARRWKATEILDWMENQRSREAGK